MAKNKINWKALILCLLVPLAVGGAAALLSRGSMHEFNMLDKPPLSPPGALFPIVWSALFLLMGLASYLVLASHSEPEVIKRSLSLYALQLAFNFLWTVFFFVFGWRLFSFFWLIALFALILLTCVRFSASSRAAAWLLAPYLLWVAFAGYLNLGIYLLNR